MDPHRPTGGPSPQNSGVARGRPVAVCFDVVGCAKIKKNAHTREMCLFWGGGGGGRAGTPAQRPAPRRRGMTDLISWLVNAGREARLSRWRSSPMRIWELFEELRNPAENRDDHAGFIDIMLAEMIEHDVLRQPKDPLLWVRLCKEMVRAIRAFGARGVVAAIVDHPTHFSSRLARELQDPPVQPYWRQVDRGRAIVASEAGMLSPGGNANFCGFARIWHDLTEQERGEVWGRFCVWHRSIFISDLHEAYGEDRRDPGTDDFLDMVTAVAYNVGHGKPQQDSVNSLLLHGNNERENPRLGARLRRCLALPVEEIFVSPRVAIDHLELQLQWRGELV